MTKKETVAVKASKTVKAKAKAKTKAKAVKPAKKRANVTAPKSNAAAIDLLLEAFYQLEWPLAVGGRFPRRTMVTVPPPGNPEQVVTQAMNSGGGEYPSDHERPPTLVPGYCNPMGTLKKSYPVETLVTWVLDAQQLVKRAITKLGGSLTPDE